MKSMWHSARIVGTLNAENNLVETFKSKTMHGRLVDWLVVMGRDFVSALRPVGLLYYPRMKANVTKWASEIR
jgi:hypothetical protein